MGAPRINPNIMSSAVRMSLERAIRENTDNCDRRQPPSMKEDCSTNASSSTTSANLDKDLFDTPQSPKSHKSKISRTESKSRKTLTPDRADEIVKDIIVSEDGNEVRFVLDVSPYTTSTSQQKGAFVGKDRRIHFFTKAKIAKVEKTFRLAFEPHAHLTRRWGRVPLEVEFDYYFPYSKSTPKRGLHTFGPMNERPDSSNLTKGICDSLTAAGMWEDDSLINTEISKKRRTTKNPCIVIRIKNLMPSFTELWANENGETLHLS